MARPKAKKASRRTPRVRGESRKGTLSLSDVARDVRRALARLSLIEKRLDGENGRGGKPPRAKHAARDKGTPTEEEETIGQRWRRLGIIGAAKDLPPDLSTNPKYMEGFGAS